MGFSLKMFFAELVSILTSGKTDAEKVQALISAVDDAKIYAKECGMLK